MLVLNGKTIEVPAQLNDIRLVDFLREYLGLKGTKYGCGQGICGACTVHINGHSERSCQLSVRDVFQSNITTIEGLHQNHTEKDEDLHPVQRAWIEEAVPQCGYCQSGQIMAASALLLENPTPTDDDIKAHMSGNLCRCGTYPRIRQAIKRAAGGQ